MKIKIRIDIGEGPVEVDTTLATIVAWERRFKRKASDFVNGIGIEDLAFMAHEACKAQKIVVPAVLDDFIKKLEAIEVVGDDPVNPTEGTPTGEDSPSS